jgi:hypothetical protein
MHAAPICMTATAMAIPLGIKPWFLHGSSVSMKPTLSRSETIGNVKLIEIFGEIFPF